MYYCILFCVELLGREWKIFSCNEVLYRINFIIIIIKFTIYILHFGYNNLLIKKFEGVFINFTLNYVAFMKAT